MLVSGHKGKSEWESIKNDESVPAISVCDVWKKNTHKIIKKTEYQTPIFLQNLMDLHAEFLHGVDSLFGTCYLWQKKYFDKLGFDGQTLVEYEKLCDVITEETTSSMDAFMQHSKMQSDLMLNSAKIGNTFLHQYLDWQAKVISSWAT